MATCPCCSNPLLRHIRNQQLTHFCRHCWQDMPVLEEQHYEPALSSALPEVYVQKTKRSVVTLKLASQDIPQQGITPQTAPQTTSQTTPQQASSRTIAHRRITYLRPVLPEQPLSAMH